MMQIVVNTALTLNSHSLMSMGEECRLCRYFRWDVFPVSLCRRFIPKLYYMNTKQITTILKSIIKSEHWTLKKRGTMNTLTVRTWCYLVKWMLQRLKESWRLTLLTDAFNGYRRYCRVNEVNEVNEWGGYNQEVIL